MRLATVLSLWALMFATNVTAQAPKNLDPSQADASWVSPDFWQSTDGRPVTENWEFAENEVRLVKPRGGRGSVISEPLPPDFELAFEWKIDRKTNSGLKYRVRRYGQKWLGLEYQIIDEPERSSSIGSTASIYDLVGPKEDKPLNQPGQWNHARIIASGDEIEHFLNGERVAHARISDVSWQKAMALSKFWGYEGFAQSSEPGRFMLTDHGGKASYRNFRFTAKPGAEANDSKTVAEENAAGPHLGNGIRNSWADQTSITLWTRTTSSPELLADGAKFVSIDQRDVRKLERLENAEQMEAAQLPHGGTLDKMFGACPGMPGEVRLTYFPVLQRKAMQTTPWVKTSAESDFTAQWQLTDLKPGRTYSAVVEARPTGGDAITAVLRGSFETAPAENKRQDISFCMTTCHDFIRRDDGLRGHKIYPAMTEIDPNFVIHAGDIEYYDKPDPWAITKSLMRFKWGRLFALPNNRFFYQNTSSYFIKDDHDTLKNDCFPGQSYGSVTFEEGMELFNQEQFPTRNPRFQTVRWGRDLQIWILEGRDYRSPNNIPDGPTKTILGQEQKRWLKETLAASTAQFKLVFSPTPIVGPDRKNKRDNHANEIFAHEGTELRKELSQRDGVIVFCGDRHWQYASKDADTGLWEFGCGPGSEKHQLGWKKGDKRPVHQFLRVAGGFLSGSLTYTKGNPSTAKLTLRHHDVTGNVVSEFVFPESTDSKNERDRPRVQVKIDD